MKKTIVILQSLMLVFIAGLSDSNRLFASADDHKKQEAAQEDVSQEEEQMIEVEQLANEENVPEGLPLEEYQSPEVEEEPKKEKSH